MSNGIVFNGFLLAAQQETASEKSEEVDLDVFLMNDSKTTVRGLTILQTEEVLEVKLLSKVMIASLILNRISNLTIVNQRGSVVEFAKSYSLELAFKE